MGRKDKERTVEEAWANPLTLDQVLAEMPDVRRKKIEARVEERIKEEMTLQEIRKALSLSQSDMATKMGITQVSISQLEKRGDLKLSTLQEYIAAAGLQMEIIVKAPSGTSIKLDLNH